MHANGNQIMEGKVLDEQVKIRIFEAFLMLRFKQNLDKLFC